MIQNRVKKKQFLIIFTFHDKIKKKLETVKHFNNHVEFFAIVINDF